MTSSAHHSTTGDVFADEQCSLLHAEGLNKSMINSAELNSFRANEAVVQDQHMFYCLIV